MEQKYTGRIEKVSSAAGRVPVTGNNDIRDVAGSQEEAGVNSRKR